MKKIKEILEIVLLLIPVLINWITSKNKKENETQE